MTGDFFMKLCRDSVSSIQGIFWKYILTPRTRKTNTNDQDWKRFFVLSCHTWYQNNFICELGRAFWGWTLSWTSCDNIHTGEGLLSSMSIWVFSFLFIYLINIGIMSYEIANIGNSLSQIFHFISSSGWSMSSKYISLSGYVLECIMLLCFISLSSFIKLQSH